MAFKDTIIGKWLRNEYMLKPIENSRNYGDDSLPNALNSFAAKLTGSGLTGAEKETNAFNAAEAQKNRDFQERMANTQIQRQTSDMQAAGLNPAMMYGSAPSPMSTSGSTAGATAPGAGLDLISAVISAFMAPLQAKQIKADTVAAGKAAEASAAAAKKSESDANLNKAKEDEIRAGIRKTDEETRGMRIVNDIREATKDAAIESARLQNDLSRSQIRELDKRVEEIVSKIDLMSKQAATEVERKAAMIAKRILDSASARQIVELLPYTKYKMSAESANQYAAAGLAMAHKLYQEKLIDSGYIDALVDSVEESARKAGNEAAVAEIQKHRAEINLAVRTGDWEKVTGSTVNALENVILDGVSALTILMDNLNPLSGFAK